VPFSIEKSRRYAVYFAPPENSALWRAGCGWLGRDAVTGETLGQQVGNGIAPSRLADITEAPRFYGFHATLKPPFHLHEDMTEAELIAAMEAFAAGRAAFEAGPLMVARLGRFLALVLEAASPEMESLAADCVRAFDAFRAPSSRNDLKRRRQQGLTQRQDSYLRTWGYPYVMEEFRFHMSLTGGFDDEALRSQAEAILNDRFEPFATQPLAVESVCLFQQDDRRTPFRLKARFPFGRQVGVDA